MLRAHERCLRRNTTGATRVVATPRNDPSGHTSLALGTFSGPALRGLLCHRSGDQIPKPAQLDLRFIEVAVSVIEGAGRNLVHDTAKPTNVMIAKMPTQSERPIGSPSLL